MSASREKKARQADPTMGEKQRLVQDQQSTAKRKTRLYAIIGVVVAVAAAALLVWDSGIFHKNAVAVTINGQDYTIADVDYYYNMQMNQFIDTANTYAEYGLDMGYDTSKTPGEQIFSTNEETGEVTTYEEYFYEGALSTLRNLVALSTAARNDGFTLSAEGQATLDNLLAEADRVAAQYGVTRSGLLKGNYGSYVTDDSYLKNQEMILLANEYLAQYEAGVEVSDSEIDAYYQEYKDHLDSYDHNYAFISGVPVAEKDADGNTIEATEEEKAAAMADAKQRADALVAAVKAGADFDSIAKDYVSESSKEYYEEEGYTLRAGIPGSNLSTLYGEWMFDSARKSGDISVFESEGSGYAVVLFVDRYLSDSATVDVRHILVKPEGDTEDATEYTDEQWAAAENEAQALLTQFLVGSDTSAEAFGALADAHSDDARQTDGSLYSPGGLYAGVYEGETVEAFENWCFDESRAAGDTGLVKTEYGWHVMYFVGKNDLDWRVAAESALVAEDVDAWLAEILETYGAM